ncbi:MAG TPA: hypothetical protein VOA87_15710, partial [Thermoanaerobaculia bacterium]|nr:hypothetical protein [Thermoanaerobaculia bacterium]
MIGKAHSRALLVASALLALHGAAAGADVHPNNESGVAIDRAFQVGDVDNINLFNGNLTLTLPLGVSYPVGGAFSYQLTLVHTSNAWNFFQRNDLNGVTYNDSAPSVCSNVGLGWRVSFGAIAPAACLAADDAIDASRQIYEAPDGSQHVFYPTLHASDPDDGTDSGLLMQNVLYTRDGSYLRFRKVPPGAEIDFPDGTIHHFGSDGRLTQIRDAFNNQMNVNYTANCGSASSCWQITDTQGRTHWVYFRNDLPGYTASIDRVVLASFGGGAATYTFNYTTQTIGRACPSNDCQIGNLAVPLLASVTLPDGSSFGPMDYTEVATTTNSDACRNYNPPPPPDTGAGNCVVGSGAIIGLPLPTLGRIEWTYQSYGFPSGAGTGRRQHNLGVSTRTTKDASGAVLGQWTYTTVPTLEPFGAPQQELVNSVVDPLGNRTVRYFSVAAGGGFGYGPGPNSFDYGRQYTPKTTYPGDSTLFLSSQVFDAGGTLKRTEYAQYVRDQLDLNGSLIEENNNNGRVLRSRTVYDDTSYADLTNSDFDGLGHFRTQQTNGTLPGNNVRTHYTFFNPAQGTYSVTQSSNTAGPYSPIVFISPWVINTSAYEWTAENSVTEFRSFCYEGNGFLARRRVHNANGSGQGANDLVQVFGHNPSGDLTSEQYYGGDNQPVATGNLCAISLPAPEYQINHTYVAGTRATSQYSGVSFKSLDRDVDGNTGLPVRSRDTSGIQTSFTYDALGRLTYAKPPQGAWTNYTYNRATSPSSLASIIVDRQQNGSPTISLAQQRYFFDGLGRMIREERKMPDGTFSQRTTAYNALGWKTAVSEQGNPNALTSYLNYDPFGRPGTIQPPDGSGHDVTLTYAGVQSVTRHVKVGTSWNGTSVVESTPTTVESYDRQGRLISVTEPSGASGATVITSYGYDVGNRLSSVSTSSAGTTQNRAFSYDLRGFLRSENHPEKDA